MQPTLHGERTLTELDFSRLSKLLDGHLPPVLADLLAIADVTSARDIAADVVRMYSQVDLVDLHTGRRRKLTVCYPGDAEPDAGFISVLSPVGCSLLGAKAGSIAKWQMPNGEEGAAEILGILSQPEADGDDTASRRQEAHDVC